jgi:hypothetical protein
MDVEFGWKYFLVSGHLEDQEKYEKRTSGVKPYSKHPFSARRFEPRTFRPRIMCVNLFSVVCSHKDEPIFVSFKNCI